MNLIMGIHSIKAALENPKRMNRKLYLTEDGKKELRTHLDKCEYQVMKPHNLQEESKKYFKEMGLEYVRVPSGAFLISDPLPEANPSEAWELLKSDGPVSFVCLDGVTDVHNAGAIMRTASFYGVRAIVTSAKGTFGQSPSFFRIASGATEDILLIKCASLPKFLSKAKEMGAWVVGLSEHATDTVSNISENKKLCLVFGSEDKGISNAVARVVDATVALEPIGSGQTAIRSLNVSVAAAVTMEKFLGVE